MTDVKDPDPQFPDHGPTTGWIQLDAEETRCVQGLREYYVRVENKPPSVALELAWIDLKREFPRLKNSLWFL